MNTDETWIDELEEYAEREYAIKEKLANLDPEDELALGLEHWTIISPN